MTDQQAWEYIKSLTYDEKCQLLELLKRRESVTGKQVPPPRKHTCLELYQQLSEVLALIAELLATQQ